MLTRSRHRDLTLLHSHPVEREVTLRPGQVFVAKGVCASPGLLRRGQDDRLADGVQKQTDDRFEAAIAQVDRVGVVNLGDLKYSFRLIDSPLRAEVNAVGELLKPRLKMVGG